MKWSYNGGGSGCMSGEVKMRENSNGKNDQSQTAERWRWDTPVVYSWYHPCNWHFHNMGKNVLNPPMTSSFS